MGRGGSICYTGVVKHVFRLGIVAAAVITIAIVALALLLAGGDGTGDVVVAPPSPTAAPSTTATPSPTTGPNPFDAFVVEDATSLVARVQDMAEMPEDRNGAYFMDVGTGEVDGWVEQVQGSNVMAISGDNRFVVFARRQQVLQDGVTYPAGYVIADRANDVAYRWGGNAQPVMSRTNFSGGWLATQGGKVLLRLGGTDGLAWFAIVDFDAGGAVGTTFQADGAWGLLSRDGTKAAILGDNLSVADLSGGSVRQVTQYPDERIDSEGTLILQEMADGSGFLLTVNPVKQDYDYPWSLHTWDGQLVSEGDPGSTVYPSATGDFIAVMEPMAPPQDKEPPQWYALRAFDTRTKTDLFRVIGVVPNLGYTTGNPWLTDGSGIVVSTPAFQLRLAMTDGSFREYSGMPSPTSPELFARGSPADIEPAVPGPVGPVPSGGPSVFDASGPSITSVSPPGRSRSFVPPWGESSEEIRFIAPHGGHGGIGFTLTFVEPYVEQAPFAGPPLLLLQEGANMLAVHDQPGGNVTGSLPSLQIEVLETQSLRLEPSQPGYEAHCGLWQQLTLANDCLGVIWGVWARIAEGWILVEVHPDGP